MGQQNFGRIQWKIFESTETEKRQRTPDGNERGRRAWNKALIFLKLNRANQQQSLVSLITEKE